MSRYSINTTILGLVFQYTLICSVISSIAEIINLFSLAPIWEAGRSPRISVSLLSRRATTASNTLDKVLRRVISRYSPTFIQSSFYTFRMITVIECLNGYRRYPFFRYTEKKGESIPLRVWLYSLRNWFRIWSSSRAFTQGSFLNISLISSSWISVSIWAPSGYSVPRMSLRSASLGFGKKWLAKAQAFPQLDLWISPLSSLIPGNCGRGALQSTPSLTYFAILQILFGSCMTSLTSLRQVRLVSFFTYLPFTFNAARYILRLSQVLSYPYSLRSLLIIFTSLQYSSVYVIFVN